MIGDQAAGAPGDEQAAAVGIEVTFGRAAADLDAMGACWAVTGGLAVSVWSSPRPAHDVDFAVSVATDEEAEVIVLGLKDRRYIDAMRVTIPVGGTGTRRLAIVRLLHADTEDQGIYVDLLFACSGIEDLIVRHARRAEVLPGRTVPVASLGHLIATKVLSSSENRPQDQRDLTALLAAAGPADIEQAREAVTAITARGFSDERHLRRELECHIREHRHGTGGLGRG